MNTYFWKWLIGTVGLSCIIIIKDYQHVDVRWCSTCADIPTWRDRGGISMTWIIFCLEVFRNCLKWLIRSTGDNSCICTNSLSYHLLYLCVYLPSVSKPSVSHYLRPGSVRPLTSHHQHLSLCLQASFLGYYLLWSKKFLFLNKEFYDHLISSYWALWCIKKSLNKSPVIWFECDTTPGFINLVLFIDVIGLLWFCTEVFLDFDQRSV